MRTSQLPWAARPVSCSTDTLQAKATGGFQFRPLMAALCTPLFAGWDCCLTGTEDLQGTCFVSGPVPCSCRCLTYFTQLDYWLPSSAISEAECLHCSPSQTWILWWRKSAEPQLGDTHCFLCICLCPGERRKPTASSTPRPWGWTVGSP